MRWHYSRGMSAKDGVLVDLFPRLHDGQEIRNDCVVKDNGEGSS